MPKHQKLIGRIYTKFYNE